MSDVESAMIKMIRNWRKKGRSLKAFYLGKETMRSFLIYTENVSEKLATDFETGRRKVFGIDVYIVDTDNHLDCSIKD